MKILMIIEELWDGFKCQPYGQFILLQIAVRNVNFVRN